MILYGVESVNTAHDSCSLNRLLLKSTCLGEVMREVFAAAVAGAASTDVAERRETEIHDRNGIWDTIVIGDQETSVSFCIFFLSL